MGKTEEVQKLIGQASIVVASGYLSIIEALSMGRSVLYVAQNPLRVDYIQGLGRELPNLHVVGNAEELAAKILDLGSDDTSRPDAEHTAEYSRRFSWDAVAAQYLKLWGVIPD
jgi:glycosyltransferase involved in cell wall biosynthesis